MLKIAKKINDTGKIAQNSNIHQKADKKLQFVAEGMQAAYGNRCVGLESTFFCKKLLLQDFHHIEALYVKYFHENRFFCISYNLELSTSVKNYTTFSQNIGDCTFCFETEGIFCVKNRKWVCKEGNLGALEKANYIAALSHSLILDRIHALDLNSITVTHRKESDTWEISCRTLIGSSTWILIPPVMEMIKPKKEEYIQLAEFFDLVANAVIYNGIS